MKYTSGPTVSDVEGPKRAARRRQRRRDTEKKRAEEKKRREDAYQKQRKERLGSGARATTAATASKPKSRGRKTVAKMTDNPYVSKFFKKKKDNAS